MLEIKGVSAKAAPEFVKRHYRTRYEEYLDSLSVPSRRIIENLLPSSWYSVQDAVVEPTLKICELFYGGSEKGAWDVGKESADIALTGVYKFFVKVGSPGFIIKRATRIFDNMLRPGTIKVAESSTNSAVLHAELPESDWILEIRMAGWIKQALIVSGCSSSDTRITQSISKGDKLTEFSSTWS